MSAVEVLLPHVGSTRALGEAIGRHCQPGDTIALQGTLGAGKTTLTQGLARGLAVPPDVYVNSPTFTIIQIYEGGRCALYHMDFYRLGDPDEAMGLGVEDYLGTDGVAVVEWPDRLGSALPGGTVTLHLDEEGLGRRARLEGQGDRFERIARGVRDAARSIREAPEPGE